MCLRFFVCCNDYKFVAAAIFFDLFIGSLYFETLGGFLGFFFYEIVMMVERNVVVVGTGQK